VAVLAVRWLYLLLYCTDSSTAVSGGTYCPVAVLTAVQHWQQYSSKCKTMVLNRFVECFWPCKRFVASLIRDDPEDGFFKIKPEILAAN